ncbi:MAG: Tetraacyldisaccharide 4-kinase [Chlamydiales bacterium]|jgi:tetraacyldisaccharide 4'-kinase|nr:Tetraacyldisaccharide 4-kinase [Chlamydiales bacterium]
MNAFRQSPIYPFLRRWQGRFFFPFLSAFLFALAWILSKLYQVATLCRNWAFDLKLFATYRPRSLVISIGNLVAGGTGKTPLTLFLANRLASYGQVAILSRGYRSLAEHGKEPVLLQSGQGGEGLLHGPEMCGDEPCLMATLSPKSTVIVGKDRCQSAQLAEKLGAAFILLDDGFQHRYLERDFDFVVVNAENPLGNGHLLPLGTLREGASGLKRGSAVFLSQSQGKSSSPSTGAFLTTCPLPIVETSLTVEGLLDWEGNAAPPVTRAGAFCGIAHPERFLKTLKKSGIDALDSLCLGDHADFKEDALQPFALACQGKGAQALICTAKDRFRFRSKPSLSLPLYYLSVSLNVQEEAFQPLLEHILSVSEKRKNRV